MLQEGLGDNHRRSIRPVEVGSRARECIHDGRTLECLADLCPSSNAGTRGRPDVSAGSAADLPTACPSAVPLASPPFIPFSSRWAHYVQMHSTERDC